MTKKKCTKKRNRTNSYNNHNSENANITAKNIIRDTDKIHNIKGLVNLGNTCYFNSMLQMILHSQFMTTLKTYCSADHEISVVTPFKDVKLILKASDVSCVERELIKIWESESSSVYPDGLRKELLKNEQYRLHFKGLNEQDSHEAFLMMLNIIKEAQIKRIRKAILDYYDCRLSCDNITDDVKAEIKALGILTEKLTLLHSYFGIIVGSSLKCESCGDMRLRFDECLHISPVFSSKSDKFDDATQKKPAQTVVNPIASNNQTKMTKNQQKKQKRIDRKSARNKKSTQRNAECTPEYFSPDYTGNIPDLVQEPLEHDIVDLVGSISENQSVTINPIIARFFGAVSEMDLDIKEASIDEFPCAGSKPDDKSFSSCSKVAVGSNSSRSSLDCQSLSPTELDEVIDNDIINKLETQLSIENEAPENLGIILNEGYFLKSSSLEDLPVANCEEELPCDLDNCQDVNTEKVLLTGDVNSDFDDQDSSFEEHMKHDESFPTMNGSINNNNFSIFSKCPVTTEPCMKSQRMQAILNSSLESHQTRLSAHNKDIVFLESETDMDKALNRLIAPLFLQNIACDSCSRPCHPRATDHIKTDIFYHVPFVLPIYISRFKQVLSKRGNTKNSEIYSYPFLLNLSSQCSKYANISDNASPVVYRLYGMIEHIGQRINSGHYVSYVCRSRNPDDSDDVRVTPHPFSLNLIGDICKKYDGDQYNNEDWLDPEAASFPQKNMNMSDFEWFRISDSHVETVSNSSILNCQAFMLFYTRVL